MRILFLVLLFQSFSYAQSKKALGFLEKADEAFLKKDYVKAHENYTKSIAFDSTNANAYFRLGTLEVQKRNENKAIDFYSKAIQLSPKNPEFKTAYSYLGHRKLKKSDFAEAKIYFQEVLKLAQEKSLFYEQIEKNIEECNFGIELVKNPLNIQPKKLSTEINQLEQQYFPVISPTQNELYFTAKTSQSDENIFVCYKKNGTWLSPKPLESTINSSYNEGTCTLSGDGRTMVFTSCEGRNSFGSCDLYISFKNGEEWSPPQNLGESINSRYWESQPALSTDGSLLFFSSNRPEGYGNRDIWVSQHRKDGTWGKAVNLGKHINTSKNEISPFIHANKRSFFFSSDGHKGLGGYDIFMAELIDGNFENTENMGFPINTGEDQTSLFITADGKNAYYSKSEGDEIYLYSFDVPQELEKKYRKVTVVSGKIKDATTNEPLRTNIEIFDLIQNKKLAEISSDSINGNYTVVLPNGSNYAFHVTKEGYFFKSFHFERNENETADEKTYDILLHKIEKQKSIVLNNIFFETKKWEIQENSDFELSKLVEILKNNPLLHVEISGHTDDIGSETDNLLLSEKRAEAVADYLAKKGIEKGKISVKGMGESQPVVPNSGEENRQMNRRIEMKIL